METQPNELKAIRILFFAMLAGQVIFALIVTVLVESGILSNLNSSLTPYLQIAAIVITITLVPVSLFIFRKRLSGINPEEDLGQKIEKYRGALIIRMAFCEIPTLFAIISYFITSNRSFLWMILLLISNFLFIYPAKDKIIRELQLNSSEQSSIGLD